MKKEELNNAIKEYVESKQLVLMSYPPDYVDQAKEDIRIAIKFGVELAEKQGVSVMGTVVDGCGIDIPDEDELLNGLQTDDKVIVQVRKAD